MSTVQKKRLQLLRKCKGCKMELNELYTSISHHLWWWVGFVTVAVAVLCLPVSIHFIMMNGIYSDDHILTFFAGMSIGITGLAVAVGATVMICRALVPSARAVTPLNDEQENGGLRSEMRRKY